MIIWEIFIPGLRSILLIFPEYASIILLHSAISIVLRSNFRMADFLYLRVRWPGFGGSSPMIRVACPPFRHRNMFGTESLKNFLGEFITSAVRTADCAMSESAPFLPKGGLEPPRACAHRILNPARLPIPPLRLISAHNFNTQK